MADKSALKTTAFPVLVCDENFIVCSKTRGAEHLIKSPRIGSSLLSRVDENTAKVLKNGCDLPGFARFLYNSENVNAFILPGKLSGQIYYAVFFVLSIAFCPTEVPRYLISAGKELSRSVELLLNSSPGDDYINEKTCQKLVNLCGLIDCTSAVNDHVCPTGACVINRILQSLCEEAERRSDMIGGLVSYIPQTSVQYSVTYTLNEIHILTSLFLLISLLISDNSRVKVSVRENSDISGHIDVVYCFGVEKSIYTNFETFAELAKSVTPIAPELGMIFDIVETLRVAPFCCSDDRTMSVGFTVPARAESHIELSSPAMDTQNAILSRMLEIIFGIFSSYFEGK